MSDEFRTLMARLLPGGQAPPTASQAVEPAPIEQGQMRPRLDPAGSSSPTIDSARNAIRHRVRDGVPVLDTVPVPFSVVRLEDLSDQIPNPANLTIFQVRHDDIPTQRYMNAQTVPGTLVAYVDNAWTPIHPTVDVDINGNFTLAAPPATRILVTYAWQYLSDGEINQFIDEARQWLREFPTVSQVPDGLVPALISYGSSRALYALQRSAILAPIRAGDSDIDWSKLSNGYKTVADQQYAIALTERESFYTQGPEAKDPLAADVFQPSIDPYTPLR